MPCINPDGTLTESARALLQLLNHPLTVEDISARLGKPLFWVRMSVRELVGVELVRSQGGKFLTTDQGRAKL